MRTDQHHERYTDPEAFQAVLDRDGPDSLLDADTVDGSHAFDLLDKTTYDSDDDGKVNDSDFLDGLDSSFFLGVGDGHSLDAADGDPSDVLFVSNSGDVGIRTMTPTATLDVAGRINAQSFTLNGQTISSWPSILNQVLDYGSSRSTFTTRSVDTYFFAHGSAAFSGSSSISISNLPLTSPSSYTVIAVRNSALGYASQAITVTKNSGSQFTIRDFTTSSSVFWFAFGY